MEIFGFLGAIIGLIAAVINRKRIVVHTTQAQARAASQRASTRRSSGTPITIGKRFKRASLACGIGFVLIIIAAVMEPSTTGPVTKAVALPFVCCLAIAAYQALAITITILSKLWR